MGQCSGALLCSSQDDDFVLDQVELLQVRASWERCEEGGKIGEHILKSLILNKPGFGRYFSIEPGENPEEMVQNLQFRTQAQRIHSFLENIVLSVGNIDQKTLRSFCQQIGSIHFYQGVNFAQENWVYFQNITLREVLRHEETNSRLRRHWTRLLQLIVEEMKAGFLNEALKNFGYKNQSIQGPLKARSSIPSDPRINEVSETTRLSLDQIQLCKDSWNKAKEQNDIGMNILIELITHKQSFAVYFGVDPHSNEIQMRTNTKVVIQARRIQGFLDSIVNLYGVLPEDRLNAMCHRVGELHFNRGVNFTADNWLTFKRITLEQIVSSSLDTPVTARKTYRQNGSQQDTVGVRTAWDRMMRLIVREMKQGFLRKASQTNHLDQ